MYCHNCGKHNDDAFAFCMECGTKLLSSQPDEKAPAAEINESTAPAPAPAPTPAPTPAPAPAPSSTPSSTPSSAPAVNNTTAKKAKEKKLKKTKKKVFDENTKKKGSKKTPIIVISLILLVAILLPSLLFLIFAYPFKASSSVELIEVQSGSLEDTTIEIKHNQPIKSVKFAANPADESNLELYTDAKIEKKGLFSSTVSFPNGHTGVGEGKLHIYVESILGMKSDFAIETLFDIGYVSPSDDEAVEEIADGIEIFANELLVTFEEDVTIDDVTEIIEKYNGEIVGYLSFVNQYQIKFTFTSVDKINTVKEKLAKEKGVIAAEYNYSENGDISLVPNDKKYDSWNVKKPSGNNWALECIDAPGAWEYNDLMTITPVGIIDSSINYDHEDLLINQNKINFAPSKDFETAESLSKYFKRTEKAHPSECTTVLTGDSCEYCGYRDHGTHCTGIVGAVANNDKGVCGVNWKADMYFASYWSYEKIGKAQITRTSISDFQFYYDICWMVASGCRVISMSIGGGVSEENKAAEADGINSMNRVFASLESYGYDFLLIKAAGNDNVDASACYINRKIKGGDVTSAHSIIVGAVENTIAPEKGEIYKSIYNLASYSNYGDFVDICAPGSAVYSTVFGSKYENMDGTSMATPMVAGVASLVYSANPEISYDLAKTIIKTSYNEVCLKRIGSKPELKGIVNAKNAVEAAIGSKENDYEIPKPKEPECGFVTGTVIDAKTEKPISYGSLTIVGKDGSKFIGTIFNGQYELFLAPGEYDITVISPNYITETFYNVKVTKDVTTYNMKLNLVKDSDEKGVVCGYVIDAFDGSLIPEAKMTFYRGVDNTEGSSPVASGTCSPDGYFSLSLPVGNYTVVLSKPGYLDDSANVISISANMPSYHELAMTPVLNEGEVRFVLSWDEYPEDLDSHLIGPDGEGDEFHIYWDAQNYYGPDGRLYNNLDLDDTTSYGPETTSIYVGVDGTYTFYVHDFSNRDSYFSTELAESGAHVKVYIAGEKEPVVFNVPREEGTLWEVCEVRDGKIIPVNSMYYLEEFED